MVFLYKLHREAMHLTAQKLPIKTKVCCRKRLTGLIFIKIFKIITMAKKIDFNKSLKDLNEADLKAHIQEDKLRLKKLGSPMQFHRWKIL